MMGGQAGRKAERLVLPTGGQRDCPNGEGKMRNVNMKTGNHSALGSLEESAALNAENDLHWAIAA